MPRVALAVLACGALAAAAQPASDTLAIYVVDVEGGEATLFVAPSGESLLVDTGWPGFDYRDADRIAAAARDAGVAEIDHLVITHFHGDHMGGAVQLAERLPIRHFVDHGAPVDAAQATTPAFEAYAQLRGRARHTVARPGDTIPLAGVEVRVIAAGGSVLAAPLRGAGAPNPHCAAFRFQGPEITSRAGDAEDSASVSLHLTYGEFRTVIMGDLNWNDEYDLMCPNDKLGRVDLYLVSHHGAETSGSPALVYPLAARAAIMNNGPRKGGAVQTFEILRAAPGLEDLWQNHYSVAGGAEHNRPESFIANLDTGAVAVEGQPPVHLGAAAWIEVAASADGSFTVTNGRNGFTKRYGLRR
jgi:beta-lactamase superfamily II metal-dependent hydrolase